MLEWLPSYSRLGGARRYDGWDSEGIEQAADGAIIEWRAVVAAECDSGSTSRTGERAAQLFLLIEREHCFGEQIGVAGRNDDAIATRRQQLR